MRTSTESDRKAEADEVLEDVLDRIREMTDDLVAEARKRHWLEQAVEDLDHSRGITLPQPPKEWEPKGGWPEVWDDDAAFAAKQEFAYQEAMKSERARPKT